MKYKGYVGAVEFDEDAEVFFGKVTNIRDTITFETSNAHELRQEFEASVDDYLAFCKECGRKPERPRSSKIMLRIPPDLHQQLSSSAALEGKSISEYILSHLPQQ